MKDYNSPFEVQEEQNAALWNALHCLADEQGYPTPYFNTKVYNYLEDTPRTSLVVELVDKLNEMGYQIVKK
jgi:hypothetical protein